LQVESVDLDAWRPIDDQCRAALGCNGRRLSLEEHDVVLIPDHGDDERPARRLQGGMYAQGGCASR